MKRTTVLHSTFAISFSPSSFQDYGRRLVARVLTCAVLAGIGLAVCSPCAAQDALPFQVSNLKKQNWLPQEAARIYFSACTLVARAIRPENPPQLRPNFVLVLGAERDETVRNGTASQVHLRNWDPQIFAHAVVIMATREVLQSEQMSHLTRDVLLAAQASVTVNELKHGR
jgi:hypothetical protein